MADMLESAASWLEGQRTKFMSRQVAYCRGINSAQVLATIGKTIFEIDDGLGAVERFESRDFLIAAAAIVLSGTVTLPPPGDKVKESAGGKLIVYEVLAPGKEPCWRYSDPFRKTLRIHTKQIGEE